jgi:hypothetical protein
VHRESAQAHAATLVTPCAVLGLDGMDVPAMSPALLAINP